ncbi:aspartyl-phosphate phosphatase Spo0E family protein [Propionispora hippei]|uniref:Spo0E like sporulation regulatory protein n=1 Tax=Propionispora hippei DSM 15287 TaxID=1123003 RepID=A0A1M6LP09_9FIRM|nr:aspartyl-phosphate phosphatase Spo0E family protein [Propionispora hippei]SHJ72885.1 Spo0E like sporulation regulatory protein [Propionispora hippei DSM 15287]
MRMEKLLQIIERLRKRLNTKGKDSQLTDEDVLLLSTKLDRFLNKLINLEQNKQKGQLLYGNAGMLNDKAES